MHQDQDLIVADEAVRLLQLKSRSSLYSLVARGFVPAVRLGPRLLRFSRRQLEALITGGGVERPGPAQRPQDAEQATFAEEPSVHSTPRSVESRVDQIRGRRGKSA